MTIRSIIAALVLAVLATAAPASAQTVDRGSTTFELSRSAAKALKKAGVTITVGKPARRISTAFVLPVSRGILSRTRYLEHSGTIGFKRGSRKIVFKDLRTTLGSTVSVSGLVARKRVSLLTLAKRKATVNAATGTALLPGTKAKLTKRAATLIRRTLKLRKLSRSLGTVGVNAALRGRTSTPGTGQSTTGTAGGGGSTTTPGGGGGTTTNPGGGGTPSNQPIVSEPPVLARPVDAHDSTATITWKPSPSWLAYLFSGDGASHGTVVSDGASESPPAPYATDFGFPNAGTSWATPGGVAGLYFSGTLTFTYPEHTINQIAKDPEIEINGGASRAIFRIDGTSLDASARNKRINMFTLDIAAATRSEDATTVTYANIPAKVTKDSAGGFFGGFYEEGTTWGSFTVSYTK